MEQRVTSRHLHDGFVLVTVLIVTAIGLLFGAGALLLFRYQCQLRIDRQHELEKIFAVRSALNYIRNGDIPEGGRTFGYHTLSERNLGLLVKPVDPVFPHKDEGGHLDIGNYWKGGRYFRTPTQPDLYNGTDHYNGFYDYEFGAISNGVVITDLSGGQICNTNKNINFGLDYGLSFGDVTATNTKWWVNIGMANTGGWLHEDFGRRYFFHLRDYVGSKNSASSKDIIRLCLIRNVTNETAQVGCRHGWPLSREKERALVFQIIPKGIQGNNAEISLLEYVYEGGKIQVEPLIDSTTSPQFSWSILCYLGIQLAHNAASLFRIDSAEFGDDDEYNLSSSGYIFSKVTSLTEGTYNYFGNGIELVDGLGRRQCYGGFYTNMVTGQVCAPDLRVVFEVEAASNLRGEENKSELSADINFLTNFRVTPAYQYSIYLEHPSLVTNLATVAQKIGEYTGYGSQGYTVLTYDTHGTEHKGFRQDEREAQRKNGR